MRMHSYSLAHKSSGAFFRVLGGERYRKRPGRLRIALRGFTGVRPRGVMVNPNGFGDMKKPLGSGFF